MNASTSKLRIRNLHIGTRLALGFGAIVAILAILVTIAYFNAIRLAEANALNTRAYATIELTHAMLESLTSIQTSERGYALTGQDSLLGPLQQGKKTFLERIVKAQALTVGEPAQQANLEKLLAQEQTWLKVAIEPVLKLRRGVSAGVIQLDSLVQFEQGGRGERAMDAMRAMLGEIGATQSETLAKRSADVVALQRLTNQLLIGGGLLAAVLASVIAFFLIRSIVRPLRHAVGIARTVAAGDLTSDITSGSLDETGQLLDALKAMNDNLAEMVGQVQGGARSITTASGEIASGNRELSTRTGQQADSLEKTVASIAQLTETVRQNAGNAEQADAMANSASTVAVKGGDAVKKVVATMASIETASKKISEVVSVIDSIAFQINILALNAAVEAARAGEQGRGFAVVAAEVRSLAQRAAAAAKEIKQLVSESVQTVSLGATMVAHAGTTMNEIVASVGRVSHLIGDISAANRDQTAGILQVNQAIAEIDLATRENAALVEQAASAAQALQDQAQHQAGLTRKFRIISRA